MAKPIIPEDLKAEMRAGRGAGRFIRAKASEVSEHAPAALEGDVDGIHDLRVATKRLREALRLFSELLPVKRARDAMVLVEDLNDGLALVRDIDVMSIHAEELAERDGRAWGFVGGLKQHWVGERKMLHAEFRQTWKRLEKSERLPDRLKDLSIRTARRKREINAVSYDRFAYIAITHRAEVVRSRSGPALATGDADQLHRVRITVKRLKYTMEPFLPVLPALPECYAPVSDAQESLGVLHDFDVLRGAMVRHAMDNGLANDESYGACLGLIDERRGELYGPACDDVKRLLTQEWLDGLLDAVD